VLVLNLENAHVVENKYEKMSIYFLLLILLNEESEINKSIYSCVCKRHHDIVDGIDYLTFSQNFWLYQTEIKMHKNKIIFSFASNLVIICMIWTC
jgi:hypothetical protein